MFTAALSYFLAVMMLLGLVGMVVPIPALGVPTRSKALQIFIGALILLGYLG